MKAFYCDTFVLPLPSQHRFPMCKYRLLRERIEAHNRDIPSQVIDLQLPPAATLEQLRLAHDADYVQRAVDGQLSDKEIRVLGFPWSEALIERSRRSSGATIAAVEVALQTGVAVNLAGGTHHACYAQAQGFCVFNDSVIAARHLQTTGQARFPLIIDLDVHQGNGSAQILQHDPSIFTLSLHGKNNFPLHKATSDLDVELPDNCDDDTYLTALEQALATVLQRFAPDVVLFVAGADPYEHDRLGKLSLTKTGLQQRDEMVFAFCQQQRLPVSVSMAGGYANVVSDIVDIHFQTVLAARQHWENIQSKEDKP